LVSVGSRSRRQAAVLVAFIVAVALTSSACGARLSNKQRTLAIQQGSGSIGNTGTTTTNGSTGANTNTPTGTTGPAGTTGGTAGTKGTTGTTTTSGGTGGSTFGPACKSTAANNGGKTDVGVSNNTINLANISDISGPVPGLFKSARDAAQAFVNYFNATTPDGICGRKLVLHSKDSKTDSTANKTATQDACSQDFAIVGSQSAFDDGGAAPVNSCKIVDIPAAAVTSAIQASPYVYAALSTNAHDISDTTPMYFKGNAFGAGAANVSQHAAFLYINAGASKENGDHDIKAYEKAGYKFAVKAAIPIQSANVQGFKPYVNSMKDKGVQFIEWIGAYQEAADLMTAISQTSGFKPKVVLFDPTVYVPQFLELAKGAAEGVYVYSPTTTLDSSGGAEQQTYAQWLQRSGVSDPPTFFGQSAWSAMRLFVEMAYKVGPQLTRAAMIAQLKKVDNWTGHGITSLQHVGSKQTGNCVLFLQVHGSSFNKVAPAGDGYLCGKIIHT
jgi:hypothetical protein